MGTTGDGVDVFAWAGGYEWRVEFPYHHPPSLTD